MPTRANYYYLTNYHKGKHYSETAQMLPKSTFFFGSDTENEFPRCAFIAPGHFFAPHAGDGVGWQLLLDT